MARRKKDTVPTSAGPPPGAPPDYPGPPSPLPPAPDLQSEHIGAPLAALGDYLGKYPRYLFELAGMLLGKLAEAGHDGYTLPAAHFLQDERIWQELATQACAKVSPDLHERVRDFIASDALRKAFFHDVLTLTTAHVIEVSRLNLDEEFSGLAERLGIPPPDKALAPEDRQAEYQRMMEGIRGACAILIDGYAISIAETVTTGADQKPHASPIRRGQIRPLTEIMRHDGLIQIPSPPPVSALLNAIHHADSLINWDDFDGRRVPTHTTITGKKTPEPGQIFVTVRGPQGSTEASEAESPALWAQVRDLDQTTSDVLLYCLAACVGNEAGAWVDVDTILNARGIKPMRKRGEPGNWQHGHRTKDRVTIGRALGQLEALHIELQNVAIPGRKKSRLVWESAAVVVRDRIWQRDLDGGQVLLGALVQLGSWATAYRERGVKQFAFLAKKALEYNPKEEHAEKFLAKYLALHYRYDAGKPAIHRTVSDLLTEARIPADATRPSRPQVRLSKALDRLHEDGVIGQWRPLLDPANLPARGGFAHWLGSIIEIEPPTTIQEHYGGIRATRKGGPPKAGRRVKAG